MSDESAPNPDSGRLVFEHFEVLTRDDGSPFELGRGAMGVTYKGFDTSLQCPVALKVINGAYLQSEVARQRFLREARAAAGLRHPNVASVYHLGCAGDVWFYTMEFIDGETVEAFMRREGAVPVSLALKIAAQVCRALSAAEKQGLIHRDIKPANMMLVREGESDPSSQRDLLVKVIDFGLAKAIGGGQEDATLTLGGFLGTPHFASPEQLEEKPLDIRSDIYSLGVTLWFMLTGKTPFTGSLAQVMSQHLNAAPPLESLSGFPEPVLTLLARLMAKSPDDRPATASEARREILAVAEMCGDSVATPTHDVAAIDLATQAALPVDGNQETQVPDFETMIEPPTPAPEEPAMTVHQPAEQPIASPIEAQEILPVEPPVVLPVDPPAPEAAKQASHFSPLLAVIAGLVVLGIFGGGIFLLLPKTTAPTPPLPLVATPSPTPTPASNPADDLLAEVTAQSDPLKALALAARGHQEFPKDGRFRTKALELFESLPTSSVVWDATNLLALKPHLEVFGKDLPIAGWLGMSYLPVDAPYALGWLEAAADAGDAKAAYEIAWSYGFTRVGVAKDRVKMVEWLRRSDALGDTRATVWLGRLYDKNQMPEVIEENPHEALRLFTKAYEKGNLEGQANLGVYLMRGIPPDVPADPVRAVQLFKDGAEKGDPACMCFYAMSLEGGSNGYPPDPVAAKEWFIRAAKLKNKKALQWCRENGISINESEVPQSSETPLPPSTPNDLQPPAEALTPQSTPAAP